MKIEISDIRKLSTHLSVVGNCNKVIYLILDKLEEIEENQSNLDKRLSKLEEKSRQWAE